MILFSKYIDRNWRIFLSLILIWDIAVIYASRIHFNIGIDYDDDFSRYYQNYLDIYDGISGSLNVWGSGIEIGLGVFYKILSIALPRLLPHQLLFVTAFSICAIFYVWLEVHITKLIPFIQRAALIAFAMFIDVFIESLGLTRQAFSSVILLYALTSKNINIKFLFLAIATSFHTSAIFIFILFHIVKYYPRVSLIFILIAIFAFMSNASYINTNIEELIITLKEYLPIKIYAYLTHYIDANGWNLYYMRYIPIMKAIFMFGAIFSFFVLMPKDKLANEYKYIVTISFMIFLLQFIPARIVFLFTHILFYFLLFIAFRKFFYLVFPIFFFYFIKRFYTLFIGSYLDSNVSSLFFSYPLPEQIHFRSKAHPCHLQLCKVF